MKMTQKLPPAKLILLALLSPLWFHQKIKLNPCQSLRSISVIYFQTFLRDVHTFYGHLYEERKTHTVSLTVMTYIQNYSIPNKLTRSDQILLYLAVFQLQPNA